MKKCVSNATELIRHSRIRLKEKALLINRESKLSVKKTGVGQIQNNPIQKNNHTKQANKTKRGKDKRQSRKARKDGSIHKKGNTRKNSLVDRKSVV